jgi:hypothetical protein
MTSDKRRGQTHDVAGRRLLVYQIYFDERTRRTLDPLWIPWLNTEPGPFLESAVIADLLAAGRHTSADYFGVFSWKFRAKIPLTATVVIQRIARDGCTADAYSFFGRLQPGRVWVLAEKKHPGIMAAAALLLRRLGLDADPSTLEAPLVYQNHFICRSDVYDRFGRELLMPALAAMRDETDTELQRLVTRTASYPDENVPSSRLIAMFGHPYFCLQPFIAERLFSTWLAVNPAVRLHHVWRGRFVEAKRIGDEPELRRPASGSAP